MDVLQGGMEPANGVDEDCSNEAGSAEPTREMAGEVQDCGFREVVEYGYEVNTKSYGRGRYSRRNCQQYTCKVGSCRKTFATWEEAEAHLSNHGKSMWKRYICNFAGCGLRFQNKHSVASHVKIHLKNRKTNIVKPPLPRRRFFCDFDGCGRDFANVYTLANHVRLHNCDTPYLCEILWCTMQFAGKEERDEHVIAHSKREAFVCTFRGCGLGFSSPYPLEVHCATHTGKKPFRCNVTACGLRVTTKFLLDVHTKTHSLLKQYVCAYEGCDKRYAQPAALDAHLAAHSSSKCTFPGCADRFRDKEAVEKHLLTHTGDQPFLCSVDGCEKRYVHYLGMAGHRRKHRAACKKAKCKYDGCEEMVSLHKVSCLQHHGTTLDYQCATAGCGVSFGAKGHYEEHLRFCKPKINFICVFEGCSEEFHKEDQFIDHYHNHAAVKLEPPSN